MRVDYRMSLKAKRKNFGEITLEEVHEIHGKNVKLETPSTGMYVDMLVP